MKHLKRILYVLVQIAWGLPQTIAGAAVFLANVRCPHRLHHGAVVTIWPALSGLSLGPFVFVGDTPDSDRLLVHEYGHTVQSLVLGPLYLPLVGLPSLIWANSKKLAASRRREGRSYYAFYTERSANWLGERVLKRPSMGMAIID